MNRRLTQRGRERRQQLMDFAAARFAEQGYHPTSVAEIVQGLGVGKGVFYWYFSSKEELFLEILKEAQQDLRRAQQQAIDEVDDPVRRIELGIQASMRWSSEHPELYNLFAFAATEERFAPAVRKGQATAVSDAMRHVQAGIDAGSIREGDPNLIAHAILGVSTHLARHFVHEQHRPWPDVADAAVAFCLEGLLVPGPLPGPMAGPAAALPIDATVG
jgi:AcrR family transcriptional regulator